MKKSIAVILLSSAILLPNHAEAAHTSNTVKMDQVGSIQYIGWVGMKSNFTKFNQYKGQSFYKNWIEFICKPTFQGKPTPNVPEQEEFEPDTPEVEQVPEVEENVEVEQKPEQEETPEVEQVPEIEVDQEQTPEVEETPEVESKPERPTTPAPEVPEVPEVTPDDSVEVETPNASVSAIEQEILRLTNAERQKAGLAPLALDDNLMNSARAKSKDMSQNKYFSHTSPTYGSPFDQMASFGVKYRAAAENIAQGQRSAEEVVRAWMNSPGHRQNILTGSFTHIGIGYDANGHYWTQQFIQK